MYNTPTYYPTAYSYNMPQPQPTAQPQQDTALIWVQGEAGAKAYIVKPGSSVVLMDSEKDFFYIKTVDLSGMPNLRVFEYKEIGSKPEIPVGNFVAREEFDELKLKIEELMQRGAEA